MPRTGRSKFLHSDLNEALTMEFKRTLPQTDIPRRLTMVKKIHRTVAGTKATWMYRKPQIHHDNAPLSDRCECQSNRDAAGPGYAGSSVSVLFDGHGYRVKRPDYSGAFHARGSGRQKTDD